MMNSTSFPKPADSRFLRESAGFSRSLGEPMLATAALVTIYRLRHQLKTSTLDTPLTAMGLDGDVWFARNGAIGTLNAELKRRGATSRTPHAPKCPHCSGRLTDCYTPVHGPGAGLRFDGFWCIHCDRNPAQGL